MKGDGRIGRDAVDGFRHDDDNSDNHDRQYVTIYESYMKKYREDLQKCVVLKVLHSRRVMLDVEIVSEKPFRYFTPFPLPHRFHGMSLADVVKFTLMAQDFGRPSLPDVATQKNTLAFQIFFIQSNANGLKGMEVQQ